MNVLIVHPSDLTLLHLFPATVTVHVGTPPSECIILYFSVIFSFTFLAFMFPEILILIMRIMTLKQEQLSTISLQRVLLCGSISRNWMADVKKWSGKIPSKAVYYCPSLSFLFASCAALHHMTARTHFTVKQAGRGWGTVIVYTFFYVH